MRFAIAVAALAAGVSVSLRRAQDALDFRVAPARPPKDGSKARRPIQASSAGHQLNLPAAPAATGARDSYSAPSLPDSTPERP